MADYNSGLPVRPQESTAQFPVEIKDASNNALIGQKTAENSLPVTLASDQTAVPVKNQDGTGNALTSTGGALDVNLKTNDVTGQATAENSLPVVLASDQTAIPVKTQDGTGNAIGSVQGALKVMISDDADGNPLKGQKTKDESIPVTMASDQPAINVNVVSSVAANPVHDYNTAAGIAANAESDHSYVVADSALLLSLVQAGASGKMKITVIDKDGVTETVKAVAYTSSAEPTRDIWFPNEITIAVGHSLVVRRKNLDNQTMEVHSFINGAKA